MSERKRNSSVMTVRVPKDLKARIEKAADKQGVSMNQFAIYAFARGISEMETAEFLRSQYSDRTKGEILDEFDQVMKRVPKRMTPDWDKVAH